MIQDINYIHRKLSVRYDDAVREIGIKLALTCGISIVDQNFGCMDGIVNPDYYTASTITTSTASIHPTEVFI